jgi:sugar lactone lactonase YvrE
MRKFLASSTVLLASFFALSGVSHADDVPQCVGSYAQKTIYSGQNSIENLIVGGGGVLYASGNENQNGVLKAYTKGVATPRTVTTGKPGGGGLAWNGKKLLWGYGDLLANALTGDVNPVAGLYSVSPSSGAKTVVSDHLGMANGIARGKDGFVYASNTGGLKLDRISPAGVTENGWASSPSANGLVVGRNGRYLYANQMLVTPSSIAMIDTRDPSKTYTYFTSPEAGNQLFDGLARDGQNNLYVAVFGKGEVWKISPTKQACVLATGLSQTSSVTVSGAKKGFKAGNLYAAGFDGKIVQVTGATNADFPG